MKEHHYQAHIEWTGNLGTGTSGYTAYERDHIISIPGKPGIPCSSDPAFRGDPLRYNPEELLLASLSSCHMLWYLHLCAVNKVIVISYLDRAEGKMTEQEDDAGQFSEVVLRPEVTVADSSMIASAEALHEEAHSKCFISRSVNFPVHHKPVLKALNQKPASHDL